MFTIDRSEMFEHYCKFKEKTLKALILQIDIKMGVISLSVIFVEAVKFSRRISS
jgi:hypothetical protein